MERVSCLCLYEELHTLLSLGQFPTYDPLCFRYCKFSKSCFNMRFLEVHLLCNIFVFIYNHFLSYVTRSVLPEFFCFPSKVFQRAVCPSSQSQLLSLQLHSIQISLAVCYHFLDFLLHFYLCWPIPLSSVHSYKLSHGFIYEETGNTTRCLAMLCELNKDVLWPVTNQLWKKWCDWLPIMTHIINLHSDT